MHDDEAPGPLTPASVPGGYPAEWGDEDASYFWCAALASSGQHPQGSGIRVDVHHGSVPDVEQEY
jgi:hypothetical protein